MRVAIPTKNGSIYRQYELAKEFTLYDVEIELVKKKKIIPRGTSSMAAFLKEQEIDAIICGNISSDSRILLRTKRIELTYNVSGKADAVMIRYLSGEVMGNLEENALMPMDFSDISDMKKEDL